MVDLTANLKRLVLRASQTTYRIRQGSRKLSCPHPDYGKAFIVLPSEWLGKHAGIKDRAFRDFEARLTKDQLNFMVAMLLVEEFGNIPGMEGPDPAQWEMERIPIPILAWVTEVVLSDFSAAYIVPKNSSAPSLNGQMAPEATRTDGSSEKNPSE